MADSGRGLHIVERLVSAWGVTDHAEAFAPYGPSCPCTSAPSLSASYADDQARRAARPATLRPPTRLNQPDRDRESGLGRVAEHSPTRRPPPWQEVTFVVRSPSRSQNIPPRLLVVGNRLSPALRLSAAVQGVRGRARRRRVGGAGDAGPSRDFPARPTGRRFAETSGGDANRAGTTAEHGRPRRHVSVTTVPPWHGPVMTVPTEPC